MSPQDMSRNWGLAVIKVPVFFVLEDLSQYLPTLVRLLL